jgi:hypothetical protein
MPWSHMFQIAINTLFEKLFDRVLASDHGGLELITDGDMSVSGPLFYDGDDIVSPFYL